MLYEVITLHPLRFPGHGLRRPVHLDQEGAPGPLRDGKADILADAVDRCAVHQLQRTGSDTLPDNPVHGTRPVMVAAEECKSYNFV